MQGGSALIKPAQAVPGGERKDTSQKGLSNTSLSRASSSLQPPPA